MIVKRNRKRALFRIRDKVRTIRGNGVIKYAYPTGPHGKYAYSVHFENKRVGEIFSEDEITLVEKY
jgi:aromatic ring-cleaving dioxygenase